MYELSQRSLTRLEGVDERLVRVVCAAIKLSNVDFGVSEGLRTEERQKELVSKGASKTMKSKHLEGKAVDLVGYISNQVSWEVTTYDDIADAVKMAAQAEGVKVRWGAAWHIPDICEYNGTMEEAMNDYVDLRRSQGKRPFIDAPHFELMD
jgi:peptidoglycan L-alanyl-D-glutamate endopeptidase CwlK